jgi:hypothetical protein
MGYGIEDRHKNTIFYLYGFNFKHIKWLFLFHVQSLWLTFFLFAPQNVCTAYSDHVFSGRVKLEQRSGHLA